ncbi:MAG TPA: thioesterase family protein [Kofleriaceae bacterium]|jgi:acyl-CoA thioesterase
MASLSDASLSRRVGDRYELDVVDGWRQGRGAFGGLVVGALVRAIEDHVGDPARKVRSVTAELPGPVEPGTVDIAVETLRRGNNVSTVRAALSQHGEIRSHVVAVLAADRAGPGKAEAATWNDLSRPVAPPWTELPPLELPGRPEFAQHFEYRLVDGLPLTGRAGGTVGWVRPRDPGPRRDTAYISAMIDAWWPAAFVRFTALRPMATITFTLDIAGGVDGLDPDAPLLHRATAPVSTDGYALETRELWSETGRLVAINHQTFVVIR